MYCVYAGVLSILLLHTSMAHAFGDIRVTWSGAGGYALDTTIKIDKVPDPRYVCMCDHVCMYTYVYVCMCVAISASGNFFGSTSSILECPAWVVPSSSMDCSSEWMDPVT